MKFFVMYADSAADYVRPPEEIHSMLDRGCVQSEFQYLNDTPIELEVSEKGGMDFPDFLESGCIPLVSQRLLDILKRAGVNNLFQKPVLLRDSLQEERKRYYLALPPRINCLDVDRSRLLVSGGKLPVLPVKVLPEMILVRAEKLVIAPENVGNYKMFRIAGITNQEIVVTEEVMKRITEAKLENVNFYELEEI